MTLFLSPYKSRTKWHHRELFKSFFLKNTLSDFKCQGTFCALPPRPIQLRLLVLFHFVWVKDDRRRSGNALAPIQVFNAVLSPPFSAPRNSVTLGGETICGFPLQRSLFAPCHPFKEHRTTHFLGTDKSSGKLSCLFHHAV